MEDLSASLQALSVHHSHGHSHGGDIKPEEDFNKTTIVHRHNLAYQSTLQQTTLSGRLPIASAPTYESLRSSPPLSRLTPIPLLHMKLGLTHYCRFVLGTLCVDAFLMSSIFTCLETEDGMAVRLSILNAVPPTASFSHVQSLFPKGARVAIKEPYLKRSNDGIVGIRIDNPSDIEILDQPIRRPELDVNALRKEGNRRFQEKDWEGAIDSYDRCIQLIIDKGSSISTQEALAGDKNSELLAYSNRAETWMKLNKFEQALQDSIRALEIDPNHVKSLFRKGRALQGLHRHRQACGSLQEALQKNPESWEIHNALQESRRHCAMDEIMVEGDLKHITDYLVSTAAGRGMVPPKCCDYTGPVVVKMTSDGHGRGLFACRDVKVGELLAVSNPLAIHYHGQETVTITTDHGTKVFSTTELVTKVFHLANSSPKAQCQLYSLQADSNCSNSMVPSMELLSTETDRNWTPQDFTGEDVDMARINGIINVNSFAGHIMYPKSSMTEAISVQWFTGIWLLPSFLNHSCVSNAKRSHIGEAMLIHATSDIKEGEEITIPYFETLMPLFKREKVFQALGFSCRCKRCEVEGSMSKVLESISSKFGRLYEEAMEEARSATEACKPFPTRLPKCALFGGLTVKLEKELANLAPFEKNLIRASYATAYLAAVLASNSSSSSSTATTTLSREEIGEAMQCAAPGSMRAILLHAWPVGGRKGSYSAAMDACIRAYGNWNAHVLETLVDWHAEVPPFP